MYWSILKISSSHNATVVTIGTAWLILTIIVLSFCVGSPKPYNTTEKSCRMIQQMHLICFSFSCVLFSHALHNPVLINLHLPFGDFNKWIELARKHFLISSQKFLILPGTVHPLLGTCCYWCLFIYLMVMIVITSYCFF